jgi:hypothetical protein
MTGQEQNLPATEIWMWTRYVNKVLTLLNIPLKWFLKNIIFSKECSIPIFVEPNLFFKVIPCQLTPFSTRRICSREQWKSRNWSNFWWQNFSLTNHIVKICFSLRANKYLANTGMDPAWSGGGWVPYQLWCTAKSCLATVFEFELLFTVRLSSFYYSNYCILNCL